MVTPCADDTDQHKGTAYCQAGTSADINMVGILCSCIKPVLRKDSWNLNVYGQPCI